MITKSYVLKGVYAIRGKIRLNFTTTLFCHDERCERFLTAVERPGLGLNVSLFWPDQTLAVNFAVQCEASFIFARKRRRYRF